MSKKNMDASLSVIEGTLLLFNDHANVLIDPGSLTLLYTLSLFIS